jgi:hypothetical protein
MTGNVSMVIFDSSSFTGSKDAKEPQAEIKTPVSEQPKDKPQNEAKDTKANDKK